MNNKIHTPRRALNFLLKFMDLEEQENFTNYVDSVYEDLFLTKGHKTARIWFWSQFTRSLPKLAGKSIEGNIIMIKNYLKIALRNIKRRKIYSFINITGLAIGMAAATVILLWVQDELSYDKFHEKAQRTYRISTRIRLGDTLIDQAQTPGILPMTLKNDFPEIEQTVRIGFPIKASGQYKDKIFMESNILPADSTFFDVFSFKLIKGDKKSTLEKPETIVITEATAQRYFGNEDPIGKVITLADEYELSVTGVIENIPRNSHFHFDMLLSMATLPQSRSTSWRENDFRTYIVLQEGFPVDQFAAKLPDIVYTYILEGDLSWVAKGNSFEYYLQPLTDIHLKSNIIGEFEPNGNMIYVYIFSLTAVFILLIACMNFTNLSTAKSMNRAKEIGIRKVVGSVRGQLIFQFLTESFLLSFIALLVGIVIAWFTLPLFNNLVGKQLHLFFFSNFFSIPLLICLALVVGFVAGGYPAFYLSSLKPILTIKGKSREGMKNSGLRNILVVLQFSITIVLFIGTFIVGKQLKYFQNTRLGFDKDQVIVVKNIPSLGNQIKAFKETLLANPGISSVAGSYSLPGGHFVNAGFKPENAESILLNIGLCDPEFIEALQLEMVQGRFFSPDFPTDKTAVILNETALKLLNWDEPIGKKLTSLDKTFHVIGVVKDFHYESLHQTVKPMALVNLSLGLPWPESFVSVRTNSGNINKTLTFIENNWKTFAEGKPFEFFFLDEHYGKLYANEKQTGMVFMIFSFLAIIIASIGLGGLAAYSAEQKSKEIGIRKVCGACFSNIILLLYRKFIPWIILANLVAWPTAYIMMSKWLHNFAYRITISFWPFVISAILALIIAVVSVSYQSIKAAVLNPVDSLRHE
ncbi:MAG: ABC transporter permease [Candidatus Aminicenantes bacterium]|nr:ABC transporter permease [Candidatus Aminicenantes bacterium]